jgi:hypothetical protein
MMNAENLKNRVNAYNEKKAKEMAEAVADFIATITPECEARADRGFENYRTTISCFIKKDVIKKLEELGFSVREDVNENYINIQW